MSYESFKRNKRFHDTATPDGSCFRCHATFEEIEDGEKLKCKSLTKQNGTEYNEQVEQRMLDDKE